VRFRHNAESDWRKKVTTSKPTFSDIVQLLDTLINKDPNIGDAPHQIFWKNTTRDAFIQITTDNWGVPGKLVTLGNPNNSNLFLALSGLPPFDGSALPQMPDTSVDLKGRHATPGELTMVATWITNSCPV
jgi:hypothetical protein